MNERTREPSKSSPAATLGYDQRPAAPSPADPALARTVGFEQRPAAAPTPSQAIDHSISQTLAATADAAGSATRAPNRLGATTMSARTVTVLPRPSATAGQTAPQRPRYQASKLLGEGGMGEVVLADDQDIDRCVAIKRLRADVAASGPALLRFADEVRTVGALQHPNIVPVYDVGIDAEGQHYFVMKYLEGETLESVIDKLVHGDREYLEKYAPAYRVAICIEVLRALEYAHAHGVIHRDIKPANVMVGPHGEVTLTDWGIAKKITPRPVAAPAHTDGRPPAPELPMSPSWVIPTMLHLRSVPRGGRDAPRIAAEAPSGAAKAVSPNDSPRATGTEARPHATQAGALLGTPLYMSPEQASGQIDRLDERSDLFSAAVMFGEFLSLRHYLAERETLADVIDGVLCENYYQRYCMQLGLSGVPAEMFHVVLKGLWREPDKRWQSAAEMAAAFERTLSGDIWVCCPFTLTRRTTFLLTRWVNRHPRLVTLAVSTLPVALLGALATVIALALR